MVPGTQPITVLCVDDHPLVRSGIAMLIKELPGFELAGEAATGRSAIQMHAELRPDITLLDLRLPDIGGLEVLQSIRAKSPHARVLILTTYDGDVEMHRAMTSGACGFLLKSMPPKMIAEAIRQAQNGKIRLPAELTKTISKSHHSDMLSGREIEVLQMVARGNRNREIGELLSITEETVKVHIKHILEKLGANDRTEAVTIALRRGFMHL